MEVSVGQGDRTTGHCWGGLREIGSRGCCSSHIATALRHCRVRPEAQLRRRLGHPAGSRGRGHWEEDVSSGDDCSATSASTVSKVLRVRLGQQSGPGSGVRGARSGRHRGSCTSPQQRAAGSRGCQLRTSWPCASRGAPTVMAGMKSCAKTSARSARRLRTPVLSKIALR
jgi:hypothetical protein